MIREGVRRPASAVSLQPAGCHQLSTSWIDALYGTSLAEQPLGKLALGKTWLLADYANYLLGYRHGSPKVHPGLARVNDPSMTSCERKNGCHAADASPNKAKPPAFPPGALLDHSQINRYYQLR